MGTNFYWRDADGAEGEHIGKRSAAGLYCYDCRLPLIDPPGEVLVHATAARQRETCPRCGKGQVEQPHNAAFVELGIAEPVQARLTGVQGASSWSWAQRPEDVTARCNRHLFEHVIVDEYGRTLTGQQFLWMLETNCPIRFTHSIGVDFC